MDAFSSFLPNYVDPFSIAYLNASYPGFWTEPQKMELMDQLATTFEQDKRVEIFQAVDELASHPARRCEGAAARPDT